MKVFFVCATLLVLIACTESPNNTDSSKTDSQPASDTGRMTIQIPRSACYRFATASDTITLKVETFPNVVTGLLNYTLKEKDKNRGEIDGVMRGDTLVADYTFMSEGTRSVRQVVFLIKDDIAIEGYGSVTEKNRKMVFENIGTIDFSTGTKLTKVECDY